MQVAKGSGGHIYYYGPGLVAEELGHRLYPDLTKNLARGTGYDALMRVRCSAGLSIKAYEVRSPLQLIVCSGIVTKKHYQYMATCAS